MRSSVTKSRFLVARLGNVSYLADLVSETQFIICPLPLAAVSFPARETPTLWLLIPTAMFGERTVSFHASWH